MAKLKMAFEHSPDVYKGGGKSRYLVQLFVFTEPDAKLRRDLIEVPSDLCFVEFDAPLHSLVYGHVSPVNAKGIMGPPKEFRFRVAESRPPRPVGDIWIDSVESTVKCSLKVLP